MSGDELNRKRLELADLLTEPQPGTLLDVVMVRFLRAQRLAAEIQNEQAIRELTHRRSVALSLAALWFIVAVHLAWELFR